MKIKKELLGKLPITFQKAKIVESPKNNNPIFLDENKKKRFISVERLNSTKVLPNNFHRPISKMIKLDEK